MDVVVPLLEIALLAVPLLFALVRSVPLDQRAFLGQIVTTALLLRLMVATFFVLVPAARVFHEDSNGYEYTASLIATGWLGEGPPVALADGRSLANGSYPGFLGMCSGLYYLFGRNRLIITAFTSLLGAASVALLFRLTLRFFHPIVARRAAQFAAFFPSMVLWSAMALKDPVVIFLLLAGLEGALALRRGFRIMPSLVIVGASLGIWLVRYYIVYFLLISVVVSLVLVGGKQRLRLANRIGIAIAIFALLTAVGMTKNLTAGLDSMTLERAAHFRAGMVTTANSGFAADADVSTTTGAASFLPLGLAVLLLGPFPWQMTSFRSLLTLPEMLLWWSLIPAVIRGFRFALRREFSNVAPLVVFISSLCFAYALTLGNVGAAYRQRAQVFIFLFIFAAAGQYVRRCRRAGIDIDLLRAGHAPIDPGT